MPGKILLAWNEKNKALNKDLLVQALSTLNTFAMNKAHEIIFIKVDSVA